MTLHWRTPEESNQPTDLTIFMAPRRLSPVIVTAVKILTSPAAGYSISLLENWILITGQCSVRSPSLSQRIFPASSIDCFPEIRSLLFFPFRTSYPPAASSFSGGRRSTARLHKDGSYCPFRRLTVSSRLSPVPFRFLSK